MNDHIKHALRIAQSLGRGNDTILAHINPREAALLKKRGGSGKINPYTGLIEFDDNDHEGENARGGDSVGGLRGDTGGYSGNQDAANEARVGDTPGGFSGDTGAFSKGDVGMLQGQQNALTAGLQGAEQAARGAEENNPTGLSIRTGDAPGGLMGDTGAFSTRVTPAQGQQDAATVAALNKQVSDQAAFNRYMQRMQNVESGGQGYAYNKQTGAFGLNQLTPSTAVALLGKYEPSETYREAAGTSNPADVLGGGLNTGPGYVNLTPQEQLRNITVNQDLQNKLAEDLSRENMGTLSSAGAPINNATLYAAHLLGAGDALKAINADPSTPIEQTGVNQQAILNNNLSGLTAGQVLARANSQMAAAPSGTGTSTTTGGFGRLAENSGNGAVLSEGAVNSSNPNNTATETGNTVNDTTPRIPVDSLEDPALIAAYNAQYGLAGPKNTIADMALGQRAPNITTDNPLINTVQGANNFLTNLFTPNYNLGSDQYNKISQNPEPSPESPFRGHGGGQQPIPYIPPVETAAAIAPVAPMASYVQQTPYIPPANTPYASLGANFVDPRMYQNPLFSQVLATGGKVHGNNAMGNALRMAMANKP